MSSNSKPTPKRQDPPGPGGLQDEGLELRSLPLETQTLYAELVEHLRGDALRRSVGSLPGQFVRRQKGARSFWYFRTSEGPASRAVEFYVGPDTEGTQALIQAHEASRDTAKEREARAVRLAAMLRGGGLTLTDTPSAQVIKGLGAAGLFSLGGVLVGTHAFIALGNALGVAWPSTMRTQDVDVAAHPQEIQVGVPMDSQLTMDVPAAIESLGMGFLPQLHPHGAELPTTYVVRGQELRIDLLTYPRGGDRESPVRIPRLNAYAQPLAFMNYLLERTFEAAIVNGGATLVRVPEPARFALHKLLVASKRDARAQTKADKDRLQALLLLTYLQRERPGDILLAAEDVMRQGPSWRDCLRQQADRLPTRFGELEEALASGPGGSAGG